MVATPVINTFTSGEIADDAWDRVDIQPVVKGCEEARNLVLRIAGPLGKRRGFWRLGAVADPAKTARLIPFRRSVTDALMLELGDLVARVWSADGSPLIDPGTGLQTEFASPYAEADLDGLRFKQVSDVIYFRHRDGGTPRTLERLSNTSWQFNVESFPNGPWRPENIDASWTLTVTGTDEADTAPTTGAGSILVGQAVALVASRALFDPAQVGARFRLRQSTGAPGVKTWSTGYRPIAGLYAASNGRVYKCTAVGTVALVSGVDQLCTTPPVQDAGDQSDGSNTWTYRHDGAGIVELTAVADATHATGVVRATLPLKSGDVTSCFSEGAYSNFRGWPRMWPSMIEERIADGATASNLDMLDLTQTAGFDPVSATFRPGLGTGAVVDTDAMRRRLGDDGAEIIWSIAATFLLCGTTSGEYIVSGGLFGEPTTPATVVCRPVSEFGSADVYPARAHKGVFYVTRGGECVRKLAVDVQQNVTADDMTYLATHLAQRGFVQLAWIPYPDEVLWARLGDGTLAAMTNHEEQQVRGWTRQRLAGGFVAEDIVALPGPGKLETLWAVVSRTKAGVVQREIWQLSRRLDSLFMDGAAFYAGAPVTVIAGLDGYEGESVRALADLVQYDLVVSGGAITLPVAAATVLVGLPYQTFFKSLKAVAGMLQQALNVRQRITQVIVRLKTARAKVGLDGQLLELVTPRTAGDVPGARAAQIIDQVTAAGDSSRDPRIVIQEDTAYDHVIYSIRPADAIGG